MAETEVPRHLKLVVDGLNESTITAEMLWNTLGTILLLALGILVGRIVWRLLIFYASRKIEAGLRDDMFRKAERLPLTYFRENKVGAIMAWFTTDVETIGEFFGWGTVMLIDAVFLSVIVILRMVLEVNWALTVLAAVPILLLAVWGFLVERIMSRKWEERQKAYDELYDFAEEGFTGIRVIKAFVKENQQIHAFARTAAKNRDTNYSFAKVSILFDVLIEILIYSVIALLMGFGGYFVYQSMHGEPYHIFGMSIEMTIGDLTQFISLFDLLIWPMIALGQIIMMHSRSKTSLQRITRFLDVPEDVKSPENAIVLTNPRGAIEFRNFSFAYPDGGDGALKNLSFSIEPGERIGVVGKIGSGKSTLAQILMRLYNVEKGRVFVDGIDIMDADLVSLRDAIAYAPQDNFLFSDTITNNIAFSSQEPDQSLVKEAADFADIDGNIEGFPKGYDTVSGERGVTLSGGQKQRISLARAYYKKAPILIMDDTVSAVDVKTEETILENLRTMRENQTTIVIASRVSTVRKFDKILVLVDGVAEGFAPHAELMKTSPSYQKMVRLQQLEAEAQEGGKSNG